MVWVMVPVPEELTSQVQSLLLSITYKAALEQWNDDSIREHLRSLEAEPRGVLCAVAAGMVEEDPIEDVEVARQFNVNAREVYGLVREANDVAGTAGRGDLIYSRYEMVDDGDGATRGRRVLYMLEGYAAMVWTQARVLELRRPTDSTS